MTKILYSAINAVAIVAILHGCYSLGKLKQNILFVKILRKEIDNKASADVLKCLYRILSQI